MTRIERLEAIRKLFDPNGPPVIPWQTAYDTFRTEVPWLLAEVERLEKQAAERLAVLELCHEYALNRGGCSACGNWEHCHDLDCPLAALVLGAKP